jgi:hypothetical protein
LPSTEDRRFEEALRAWAGRPPRTPPEEAARRIAERLPERRAAHKPVLRAVVLLAAAVFVLAVGLALFLGPLGPGRSPEPAGAGATPPAGVPVAPAGDVLVLELDAETTLYMTLQEGDPS